MELIKMPRLGITMKTGTIGRWLKASGEQVEQGEAIFELETDKSTVEVEAQESGILHIVVEAGVEVPVNTVVGVLSSANEVVDLSTLNLDPQASGPIGTSQSQDPSDQTTTSRANPAGKTVRALPRVRRLASELGVDLSVITGTGINGEITEEDVRLAARGDVNDDVGRTVPLTGIRKAMADNMIKSWSTIPQFTQMVEVDASRLVEYRNRAKQLGDSVGYTEIVLHVVAQALIRSPEINARYENGNVVYLKNADVGVAVETERGLVVPVIRSIQGQTLAQIRTTLRDVVERARAGTLRPEDYAGGSLTVSNLGMYNVEKGTPILNPGHSCLVFVGTVKEKPVVVNGEIAIRPIMSLSFTYDHRIIDGVQAAQFTNRVREALEQFT